MTKKEASRLMKICGSAREHRFNNGRKIIKAVSVAERDSSRPEVSKILQGQETLWPPGACNAGMTWWIQARMWYPIY